MKLRMYFRNTLPFFDYDSAKNPLEGNLYDLRVATTNQFEETVQELAEMERKIERLEQKLEKMGKILTKGEYDG